MYVDFLCAFCLLWSLSLLIVAASRMAEASLASGDARLFPLVDAIAFTFSFCALPCVVVTAMMRHCCSPTMSACTWLAAIGSLS